MKELNQSSRLYSKQYVHDCLSLITKIKKSLDEKLSPSNNPELFVPCSSCEKWHVVSIPENAYISSQIAPKTASCELEVDILAVDIQNRFDYFF